MAVIKRAPAMDTVRPSSLCVSIVSAVDVTCVMAAGALFRRFNIVLFALELAVLTAAFAAF